MKVMDFFEQYTHWKERAQRAERILANGLCPKEIGRAQHLKDLEVKTKRLQREVRDMQVCLEERNRQLRALKLIVYCSGGCAGGVPEPEAITEDVVKEAERNTKRLREWWESRKSRFAHEQKKENAS